MQNELDELRGVGGVRDGAAFLEEPPPFSAEVDEFVILVYERILARPGSALSAIAVDLRASRIDVRRALDLLRGLRLVKDATGNGEEILAVSPEAAQVELLLPLERAIHDNRSQLAAGRRQLMSFVDAFNRTQHAKPRQETIVLSTHARETELRLVEAAHRCTSEVLMVQPCIAQEAQEARYARPLLLDALQRGARARVLYPHAGRADTVTRSYLRDVTFAGGEVRTSNEIFDSFIVFGRDVAFIPAGVGDGNDPTVAVVYEPVIAHFLSRIFDRVWQSAMGFDPSEAGYSGALDEVKSTILDLLASGLKDEVIARRVGMSERTLRRHISAIMQDLAADSRFQAGVAAAQADLVGSAIPSPRDR
ncbi:LuxR family transcriptional regulator [Solihabitans fulvus]|uniref:LuxR family transcriptional regulator n=2 Tax=Solihabitans fulvus TaxID=1892852 RepID=A0A5B2XK43_9PSEU|nr:LuxR family transcriptional regulator [Solihabitans fulvus]